MELIVENLIGGYGKKDVLHGISFKLNEGEVLCVLGPNGCGKSTLLKLLLRLLPKKQGSILLNNQDTGIINRKTFSRIFSYIPQSDNMLFPYTILEMVTMGRSNQINAWSTPSKKDIDIAYEKLDKLKIAHMANKLYTRISKGEKQLVLIARALCQDTKILIMDEPSSSLDFANEMLIMEAISTIKNEGKSVIMTTHSPSEPFLITTKVLLISQGYMVGYGSPLNVLTNETLESVYGIPMDVIKISDRNNNNRHICLPVL